MVCSRPSPPSTPSSSTWTVSLVSNVFSVVVVLMEVSLLSIFPLGVQLSSVIVNFWLDYLMLEVLVFGFLFVVVDWIVTGKMLDVELP